MKPFISPRRAVVALAAGLTISMLSAGLASAAEPAVGLGTATSYAILAGSAITNTGPTTVTGDIGISPNGPSSITDNGALTQLGGSVHAADGPAGLAKTDLVTAYNDAAQRTPTGAPGVELGGQTLLPGVYGGGTALAITGTLTLNAQGDSSAVWIFQSSSTLLPAANSQVLLTNGANPCNVFWQVSTSATLGTNAIFVGTIMASTSITANTGATIQGRLLAQTGAVTLDTNTISAGNCAVLPAVITPSPTSTTTPPTVAPTAAPTTVAATPTTVDATATTVDASGTTAVPGGPTAGGDTSTTASAFGDDLLNLTLPRTGGSSTPAMVLASATLVTGIVVVRITRRGRSSMR